MVNSDNPKLPGLQIARAIAALTIAYIHSWHVTMPFPPGTAYPIPFANKFPAVELFFCISGFVICMIAAKPNFRPLPFLVRRAVRIYPLWIITSLAFLYLSITALGLPSGNASFTYSLTLLPTDGFPFYDLGWSLQHEIAFYILAAALVPAAGLWGLSALLVAGIVIDQAVTLPWYLHQYASYYPYFLVGIGAFAANGYAKPFGVWLPVAIGAGLLAIGSPYPIALFFIVVGLVNIRADSVLSRIGVLLGDASYSIYLIHPLVFYFVYSRLQPPLPPTWSQELLRFGCIAVVCVISIASWKLFESPIIRKAKPAYSLR